MQDPRRNAVHKCTKGVRVAGIALLTLTSPKTLSSDFGMDSKEWIGKEEISCGSRPKHTYFHNDLTARRDRTDPSRGLISTTERGEGRGKGAGLKSLSNHLFRYIYPINDEYRDETA